AALKTLADVRGTISAAQAGASPELTFHRTATGVTATFDGVDGLAIAAEYVRSNGYGMWALVAVQSGDQICHRQGMNLDDPDHRRRFIHKLTLSCEQAGMTVSDGLLALILTRITPRVLIELREVCRRPPPTANLDREDEQARRTEDRRVAEKLLRDPGVLSRVEEAMEANGYAGDFAPAMLAYVALTSRLLRDERPLSLAIVGDAAAGKNATINAALALVPRDAVYEF